MKLRLMVLLMLLLPQLLFAQAINFSADSSYTYTEYLSVTIGGRPMGSINERLALDWAAAKFRTFSADTVFIMRFDRIEDENSSVNTNSGNAVAVFKGKSDSTIVIGGHIDSASRMIGGANDNASGAATVLELARIWGQRPRRYTMVFVTFGGEEVGLIGSEYFVEKYHEIDKVVLMFSLDMAGGEGSIETIFETIEYQAPKWLVKDAFAVDKNLGINRLKYPTHFESINISAEGAGSDHMSFLDRKIPAIDFTSGINNSPIHTPGDRIEFVSKEQLQNYGLLVDTLLKKYQDSGIPSAKEGRFMLCNIFGVQVFIPSFLISAITLLALVLGSITFFFSRKTRLQVDKSERIRFSGFKVFLVLVTMAIFLQLGESVIQAIKGLRYPWYAHVSQYIPLAIIWAVAGLWLISQVMKKGKFSPDPYVYSKRAFIVLFIYTIPLLFVNMRLALYPGIALLLFSLTILVRQPFLKTILGIIAPLPFIRLMVMEELPFFLRIMALAGLNIDTFGASALFAVGITLLLVIWYLPLIFIYSYMVTQVGSVKTMATYFRKPLTGLVLLFLIIGYSVYLYILPSYNDIWRPVLAVNATYNIQKQESKLRLIGNEYFKDVNVQADSLEMELSGKKHSKELPLSFAADWLFLNGNEIITSGERDTLQVDWIINSTKPMLYTSFTMRVDTADIGDMSTDLNYSHSNGRVTFTWNADPPEKINVSFTFTKNHKAKIIRNITARYAEMPLPISVTSDLAYVRYQTTVVHSDTLDVSSSPAITY